MKACLNFNDILEMGQPQLLEMQRLGEMFSNAEAPEAGSVFSRQVRIIEGVVVQTYGVAASLTRKTDDLSEVAEIWSRMSFFCQSALPILSSLKVKYPHCGTPELYDLVLDYKLACDKRHKGVLEEIACQTTEIPRGLFPEMK